MAEYELRSMSWVRRDCSIISSAHGSSVVFVTWAERVLVQTLGKGYGLDVWTCACRFLGAWSSVVLSVDVIAAACVVSVWWRISLQCVLLVLSMHRSSVVLLMYLLGSKRCRLQL